jgi:hypothetical protein
MANEHYKEFINGGILGPNAGVFGERTFAPVKTNVIGKPDYDPKFFETFPTTWASAYAFERSLEEKDSAAIEEWLSLFCLHYFGVVYINPVSDDLLKNEYDKDLWPAISRTYPMGDSMHEMLLLSTDDGVIVGSYYPDIVFFPSRGRASWQNSRSLKPYLEGTRLSWARCKEGMLQDESARKEFYAHLKNVMERALEGAQIKAAMGFLFKSDDEFREIVPMKDQLSLNPMKWLLYGKTELPPATLLNIYPLKRRHGQGTTYYLITGMPQSSQSEWMTQPIMTGAPSPMHYHKVGEKEIVVRRGAQQILCKLENEQDKIVLLKDLFLTDPTYLCAIPKDNGGHESKVRGFHKLEVRDTRGIFSVFRESDTVLCLAPVGSAFLEQFSDLLRDPDNKVWATRNRELDGIDWFFRLSEKITVKWFTRPINSKELPNSTLTVWPPKVSKDWHLYLAYGKGPKKEEWGRWALVDEKGSLGKSVEIDESEYYYVLHDPDGPNRPRAMLLNDVAEKQRGVLFLSNYAQEVEAGSNAQLSIDFGTSNTCLAYKVGQGEEAEQASTLVMGLSPVLLWGTRSGIAIENPGFVPFNWSGGKFFPSILLTRKKAEYLKDRTADGVSIEDFLQIDIPGLHKNMEERLAAGELDTNWKIHSNLKWELGKKTPWRSLFLGLSLLYAHAEVFFRTNGGAKINKYVFTYPLALPEREKDLFINSTKTVIDKIRETCYGSKEAAIKYEVSDVDESTAIATYARMAGAGAFIEVFIDIGGGTADIAVRHGNRFLVLDSIKVAGRTFFRFAEDNFKGQEKHGAPQFKKHLGSLLLDADRELSVKGLVVDLGTFYSLKINRLDDDTFKEKELDILKKTMGSPSYQLYRARLFFRHIIAYALLQACAALVDNKIDLTNGIKLVFGGNAWALILFAEFARSKATLKTESQKILDSLLNNLNDVVEEEEKTHFEKKKVYIADVSLLNERKLTDAKTSVALGSLMRTNTGQRESTKPYVGVTLRNLRINNSEPSVTIRWCDRWGFDELKNKLGFDTDTITSLDFDQPQNFEKPFDPLLTVFTRLANSRRLDLDPVPEDQWSSINGMLCQSSAYLDQERLSNTPINYFISRLLYPDDEEHDFLKMLARINGNFA